MRDQKIGKLERPQSLRNIAAEAIRYAIITGQYELGEALSENSLTELLGISKTPIREALALLKHEGLVTIVPQKGTFVFTMSVSDVAQLELYRFTLESMALDLSMTQRVEPLVSKLFEICDAMATARNEDDVSNYLKLDGQFHKTIIEFCDNKYLAEGYKTIAGKAAALRTHLSQNPNVTVKSMSEHVEIAKLLRDRELEKAKQVLKRHITRGERTYGDGIEDIAAAGKEKRRIKRRKRP